MATLTRPKTAPSPKTSPLLASKVPSPFPREQLEQLSNVDKVPVQLDDVRSPLETMEGPSRSVEADLQPESSRPGVLSDLMPSIAYVQKSCLMTLNNLLSAPTQWHPIVPDRRHSMPSSPQTSTAQQADLDSSSSALHTLVSNLRNRQANGEMIESRESASDSDLIHELQVRVESISASLASGDAVLANALVSILSNFNRLSVIHTTSFQPPLLTSEEDPSKPLDAPPPIDLFDALKRQLSDFQLERLSSQSATLAPGAPPVLAVEMALLWSKIDEELEAVVAMCKERTESLPRFSLEHHLPPQYDAEGYEDEYEFEEHPPVYEPGSHEYGYDSKTKESKVQQASTNARLTDEKMRLDLEAIAMAIDRLYLVAPQLHNQRVELKSSKLAEMEKARREGGSATSSRPASRGKGKERDIKDVRELEKILDLLGKASERSLHDQTVVLEGGMQSRLEKARLREMAKKEQFVEQLVRHSGARRLHGQDAVLQPRLKDPEAMLTLPEFIRESIPPGTELLKDPQTMLTLPEFVKEPPPIQMHEPECDLPPFPSLKQKKKLRSRSLSAPPLSWLRSSKSNSQINTATNSSSSSRPASRALGSAFDVIYVAENHENLQHILVFFTVTGATPGVDIEAEVLPPFPGHGDGADHLVIKCGPNSSLPLMLPASTTPGKKDVRVQSGHYEIKISTLPRSAPASDDEYETARLLGASELSAARPTSFICASCSLPLIQSSKVKSYRDLPSEHWEELVEAWMCHTDQRLHDHVVKHSKGGFWPQPGEALVGGSYLLFEDSSMINNNLYLAKETKPGENWRLARCLCGAIVGRCQDREGDESPNPTVYRVLKYAIRPVSPTAEPVKIPLSAFIVEDMNEFVQAHASYRFVIRDEEEELPRILIWLFKPKLRLAYAAPTSRVIPKSASIQAAKVLYKLLKPSTASVDLKSILNKYPGFPQAEHLSYPMSICRRLAGLLKESNSAYPDSLKLMTGLEVGWLHRA